eukprot:CAMPEP_0198530802 /NCGR_PEP_ID=MMETSP1462-20131121/26569_1 /TAXON_ID=1333877 /ORGANISM="Brandtodinium nutriculum, Strain RCC3387" /LENGTH=168 /DNA_ID=CAMNT_0044260679 /DNA_START=57 /DNA_END=563 /DNA_ORIENTATION=+
MATPTVYGGGEVAPRGPQPDIVLQANTVEESAFGGVIWDASKASRFHSLAEPGKIPPELRSYMTDKEFEKMMKNINYSIQWGITQRKYLCPVFAMLWIVILGPILLCAHIFCFHYPLASAEIERTLKPLRAKGLRVDFVWAPSVCEGGKGFVGANKIHIWLPRSSSTA